MEDRNHRRLEQMGWKPVKIGKCPAYNQTDSKNGYLAKRYQYGLRHFIATTIHAVIGSTLNEAAIGLSRADPDYNVWEPGMVQVVTTRTKNFKDLIWVGEKEDILGMLIDVLLKENQQTEYIDSIIDHLSVNRQDIHDFAYTGIGRPYVHEITPRSHCYKLQQQQLPTDNTGVVYMLISMKTHSDLYIGETVNIVNRLRQHNSGIGAKQTRDLRYRPWALLAYVTGFAGDVEARKHFEKRWQYYARRTRRRGDISINSAIASCHDAMPEFFDLQLRLINYAISETSYEELMSEPDDNNVV